jgi:membrane associated rhomboid family serine protease
MGLYDREYYREERTGLGLRGPSTMVGILMLINVILYFVDQLIANGSLGDLLAARVRTLTQPWMWWQFVTYGFIHVAAPQHIIFNMLGLWFFGRDIEEVYGRKEFLRLYLALLVVGSVVWALINRLQGNMFGEVVGASGAVAGIIVLYALHFPHRTILLMFVLPVPAWFLGLILVVGDALGALNSSGSLGPGQVNVAYTVHLAGAAFAFLYYRMGGNLGRLVPSGFSLAWLKPRPRLRVHDPDHEEHDEPPVDEDQTLAEEVDRILEKIHQQGEASLTRRERRILEDASRKYQQRRRHS